MQFFFFFFFLQNGVLILTLSWFFWQLKRKSQAKIVRVETNEFNTRTWDENQPKGLRKNIMGPKFLCVSFV